MFNFFKKKGKGESAPELARKQPIEAEPSVGARASRNEYDITTETPNKSSKDVVNLLLPQTDYNQKTGVGAILQIMAGKRKKNKKKRTESCRISPPKETQINLQRSKSNVEKAPTPAKNTTDSDAADFVKALVLQKYANKDKHVSLVYVNEPDLEEKRHAEALLREIARSIDCTIDKINDQMGATDSKESEPVYETIRDKDIDSYKNDLKGELEKLLEADDESKESESLTSKKKSNLKPPKSDTEGCSDDDRSDCGKKRVTFRKHIVFDDGEQQTDDEVDSSFESLSSEEEEDEYLEDSIPDNDELLGGFVVSRNEDENKTVINVDSSGTEGDLRRISSDNSDSGFIEGEGEKSVVVEVSSDSDVSESETEEEIIEEIVEVIEEEEVSIAEIIEPDDPKHADNTKTLVSQESKFQTQVAAITELADNRCGETERARELIAAYRKEIEEKDQEIQHLKCELAAAYKESELIRQRSRSLEEELTAARSCSAHLAEQLQARNDECVRQLRSELDEALTRRGELESRVLALERDKDRLEHEKVLQEQKAQEAIVAAEENTAKWRTAHEAARSQAAARAERMLADCEWKMRELEKKAREAEKQKKELVDTVEQLKTAPPSPAHMAELQQLRGLATEQQRSVQSLTLQLQRVETREEALKLEVHRLKELLDREGKSAKEKEELHYKAIERLEKRHSETIETLKAEHIAAAATSRATLERSHAERTRNALAQLRAESEQEAKNADRKLREVTTRFENLKEVLASKESQFERAIAEANSKADWDILQLRHLLDKADITYANNIEQLNERFDKERERLIEEWSQKLRDVEEEASTAANEAKKLLEETRMKLVAEKTEQVNKLKDQHRQEMDEQWEQFMFDKESCLERMKLECRQEGDEERIKRERELLDEIAELKSQVHSKSVDFDNLAVKAASCGRTLAVTEQELREALAREKELREKRSEDGTRIKQVERASREQIEHLNRKCSCLRKLSEYEYSQQQRSSRKRLADVFSSDEETAASTATFDDMRARLSARERTAEQESRAKEKELNQLRAEVARLTKILVEQSSPKLGTRTRADGCEYEQIDETQKNAEAPRRKGARPSLVRHRQKKDFTYTPHAGQTGGGTLRTPEMPRKRTLPDLLLPTPPPTAIQIQNRRRRAKSVDLPAVQVPVRIKQLQDKME